MWLFASIGVLPGFVVWYTGPHGGFDEISGYNLFPLFGLLAFGLMWSHYIVAAVRLYLKVEKAEIKNYWTITSWLVLIAIILHPAILAYNLVVDGFGLPPASYMENYVAPSLRWAAFLGTLSFLIFLAYEFHRWFATKKWWPLMQVLSDFAMIAILIHGFRLGGDLQSGWFRLVWLMYAETLIIAMIYIYYSKFKSKNVLG